MKISRNVTDSFSFFIVIVTVAAIGYFIVTTIRLYDMGALYGLERAFQEECNHACRQREQNLAKKSAAIQLQNKIAAVVAISGLAYCVFKKPDESQVLELP